MQTLFASFRVFLVFAIILGIIYPLAITGISQLIMPKKANGSLIIKDEKIIGSTLIGQEFTSLKYFHGRPSAINYNAATSGATDFGPTNPKLYTNTIARIKHAQIINNLPANATIPADMVLTSGSGLDPHISLENALLQMPRVAKTRNISTEKLKKLIINNIDPDFIGLWGKAGVNVLKLNLALDKL